MYGSEEPMTQEDKVRVGRAGVGHSESRSFVSWNECGD